MDEKRRILATGLLRDALVASCTIDEFFVIFSNILTETLSHIERTGQTPSEDMKIAWQGVQDICLKMNKDFLKKYKAGENDVPKTIGVVVGTMPDHITKAEFKAFQDKIEEMMSKAIIMCNPKTHQPVGYEEIRKNLSSGRVDAIKPNTGDLD